MKEEKDNVNEVGGKSNKNLKKMSPLMVIGIIVVLVMILVFLVYLITLADNAVYEVKNEVDNEIKNVVTNNDKTDVEDSKEVVEMVYDIDNASIEISDFDYDNENLIVKLNLKFKEKPEYFFEDLIVYARLLVDGMYYDIEPMNRDICKRVSDLEYTQIMRYDISNIEKNKDVKYLLNVKHYNQENWDDPTVICEPINTWELTKDFKSKNGNVNKYYFEDKYIKLFETKEVTGYIPEDIDNEYYIKLLGIYESDKYTRFVFGGKLEFMGEYCIEIIGEDGKAIVENYKEKLDPNSIFEILLEEKLNLNQNVTVNAYKKEYNDDGKYLGYVLDGTITLNLKDNLVQPKEKDAPYEDVIWNDFIINHNNHIQKYEDGINDNYMDITVDRRVNGFVDNAERVAIYKINEDTSAEEVVKTNRFDDMTSGGYVAEDGSLFSYYGNFELPDEKVNELIENGSCEYLGDTYTEEKLEKLSERYVSEIKEEIKDGIKVYSYNVTGYESYSVYCMNINGTVYKIEVPRCIYTMNQINGVLNNIKLNK